ncbi:MAG: hypothetical protein B9S32_01250 [Verrucomicrobia bacterium Tous-C9LFEB]|nr:MAG: hypothetical protein B9S32_01250 [Verrucomicrobia bacterium Tous-C9LFEB]
MIVAPLCEEFFFRTMLQNSLNRIWSNRTSVLATAIFFGLYHLNLLRFTETFILGFFSGIVFLKTRNLWCAVLLHVTCNALGPTLLQHAPQLGLLLNPGMCIGLTIAAVVSCYYLGPKSPPTVKGLWQRFRWSMFGTPESLLKPPTGSRRITILAWSIGLLLFLLLGYALFVTLARSGMNTLQARLNAQMVRFNYVVTENDTWTILASEQVSARSELFIKKSPKPYQDLNITLPFKNATLQSVKIGNQEIPFSHIKESDYRIVLSGQPELTPTHPLIILWHFPFTMLTALPDGYRTPLKSLAPSDYLSLDIAVAENSGFRLLWNKGNPTQRVVYITPEKIRMDYGSCGLGIEKEKTPQR